MKARDYLKLTELMMTAQADYYGTSKKFGSRSQEAIAALVKARGLEKQVWAVIKEGKLEPDEPTYTTVVHTTAEFQEQMSLINEAEINRQLDFTAYLRPTDGEGDQPT
jgi:hypothetical protein